MANYSQCSGIFDFLSISNRIFAKIGPDLSEKNSDIENSYNWKPIRRPISRRKDVFLKNLMIKYILFIMTIKTTFGKILLILIKLKK